jgi:uncharacterized coiled-coil DUF342 family protein
MSDKEDDWSSKKEKDSDLVSSTSKEELYKKLDVLRNEVSSLRDELNSINAVKEDWFSKREKFGNQIAKLISEIRQAKSKRDSFTKEVRESKKVREELNKQIKDKISEVRKLSDKKKDIENKHNIRGNPSMIKSKIDELEYKVETNVMSFNKELEIMKQIKELRKQFVELQKISGVWNDVHSMSKDIEKSKVTADDAHRKIQVKAKESQEKHEEIITKSKEIDELKVKEDEAFKKFSEEKKKFVDVNEKLQQKLIEMNQINQQIGKQKADNKEEKRKNEAITLKDKELAVQEKIKKGGKITTEDLLVFQGLSNKKR